MIKVLFIGMTPNPGGLETYMISIFSQLQNKGFHFDFVNLFTHKIAYSKYIKRKGGHIYNIPLNMGIYKYITRYHLAKVFFRQHHKYNIVHINALSINQIYWAKAAKSYGIKNVIIQSHNSNILYKSFIISLVGKLMGEYNRFYLKLHKYIHPLAVSYNSGSWMFGKHSHFKVLCNGINTKAFIYRRSDRLNIRRKLNIRNKEYVIITTSRLAKQKNYSKIINIFNNIHKINKNVKLMIIGGGPELHMVHQMVDLYNLNKSVIFLGRKNKCQIPKLLHSADLMLMPSLFEGYPYSLLEAQAAGVPALVSYKVIPKESNITNCVTYLPLNYSNLYWAKIALKLLKFSPDLLKKIHMNYLVSQSKYNIYNSIEQIKSIYFNLMP